MLWLGYGDHKLKYILLLSIWVGEHNHLYNYKLKHNLLLTKFIS